MLSKNRWVKQRFDFEKFQTKETSDKWNFRQCICTFSHPSRQAGNMISESRQSSLASSCNWSLNKVVKKQITTSTVRAQWMSRHPEHTEPSHPTMIWITEERKEREREREYKIELEYIIITLLVLTARWTGKKTRDRPPTNPNLGPTRNCFTYE